MKKPYSKIINASEIGQFSYCSISWYLQKQGYKPESELLDIGTAKHKKLGRVIDITNKNFKVSFYLKLIGLILLLTSFIILFLEVV